MKRYILEELEADISKELQGGRADTILAGLFPQISRTRIQGLMEEGYAFLNEEPLLLPKKPLKEGDRVRLQIPKPLISELDPEDIPLDILYEDDEVLVLNKPAGLVVHPAPGNYTGTLVQALLHHCGDSLKGISGVKYPGIVHRLDRKTSGAMIVAKSEFSHHHLSNQLKDRSLKRTYHALCWGIFKEPMGTISAPMGLCPYHRQRMGVVSWGKEAITHYKVLETFHNRISLVECRLETGRTHQIRVHMTHIKHPLLGDPVYGRGNKGLHEVIPYDESLWPSRQALHAINLAFIHPKTGESMSFHCPYPEDILYLMEKLLSR